MTTSVCSVDPAGVLLESQIVSSALVLKPRPTVGTIDEKYLIERRGVHISSFSPIVFYHPRVPDLHSLHDIHVRPPVVAYHDLAILYQHDPLPFHRARVYKPGVLPRLVNQKILLVQHHHASEEVLGLRRLLEAWRWLEYEFCRAVPLGHVKVRGWRGRRGGGQVRVVDLHVVYTAVGQRPGYVGSRVLI